MHTLPHMHRNVERPHACAEGAAAAAAAPAPAAAAAPAPGCPYFQLIWECKRTSPQQPQHPQQPQYGAPAVQVWRGRAQALAVVHGQAAAAPDQPRAGHEGKLRGCGHLLPCLYACMHACIRTHAHASMRAAHTCPPQLPPSRPQLREKMYVEGQ